MGNTLCLNMIVKNEAAILGRALDSVKDYIDYWVICDTGSTDGTQELLRTCFRRLAIPGELHSQTWKDFGTNRTEALRLARGKADYILLMDADMALRVIDPDFKSKLTRDAYQVRQGEGVTYYNTRIIKGDLPCSYVGVTHEFVRCERGTIDEGILDTIHFADFADGSNRPEKFTRDIDLLKRALAADPDNARYRFYLAQSYFDRGDYEHAIEWYSKRIESGGWHEEVFYSRYRRARAFECLQAPDAVVVDEYTDCYERHPERLEALHAAVHYCRNHGLHDLGYELGQRGLTTPQPPATLFLETSVYDYQLLDETSVCAYHAGRYSEGLEMCRRLLEERPIPADQRQRIEQNQAYFRSKLGQPKRPATARRTIVIYAGYDRLFDGDDLARPAYGSELALLALARELARDYNVYVCGPCLPRDLHRDGVVYTDSAGLRAFAEPIDILIVSRYIHYFLEFVHRAGKTFLWCHDTNLSHHWDWKPLPDQGKPLLHNVLPQIDGIVLLSEWHKRHFVEFYGIPDDKVYVIGNAIDPEMFEQPVMKQANKLVWSSDPGRGLLRAIEYLDEVRPLVPDIELHVYRGEEDFDESTLREMSERPYIHYGGKKDNAFVIGEYQSADLWLYPTNFHETYCISALEAQMAGCVCVCSNLAALATTVADRGVLIDTPVYGPDYKARMIDEVVRILSDPALKREYQRKGKEWAREQTWQARAREWIRLFGDDYGQLADAPRVSAQLPENPSASGPPARVELLCNWTDSKSLCETWNKLTKGDRRWSGVVITPQRAEESNPDYYCIVNHPRPGDRFDPARTILLRMEQIENARPYFPAEWVDVDRQKLFYVADERNSLEWHLNKTYRQLMTESIVKTRLISAVISDLYNLPGQQKRVDFLSYLEDRGFRLDLYGRGNEHKLRSYVGSLPYHAKDDGILPYKYTIAAESIAAPGYVTEKLVDAILGETLCFYWGCPDLESWIDAEAFVRIDLDDFDSAYDTLVAAIDEDQWSRRIGAIRKAKRKILTELQVMPMLDQIISQSRDRSAYGPGPGHNRLNAFYEHKEKTQYFHGDDHLIALVNQVIEQSQCTRFVITGAYRGGAISYLASRYPDLQVLACEADAYSYEKTVENIRHLGNATVVHEDSHDFLRALGSSPSPTVFWLDTHATIKEDVAQIVASFGDCCIFVDDFAHPLSGKFTHDIMATWENVVEPLFAQVHGYVPNYDQTSSIYHPLVGYALLTMRGLDSLPSTLLEYGSALQRLTTVVLNLDRRPDRMASFAAMAERIGLAVYERRAAIDGATIEMTPEIEDLFAVSDAAGFVGKRVPRHHGYNAAAIACAMSHYRVWEQLASNASLNDDDACLVLEDDVRLDDAFVTRWYQTYAAISRDPAWDLMYLGLHDDPDVYGDFWVLDGIKQFATARRWHGGGTHAYCIRKRGARRLLDLARELRIQQPIDHFMLDQLDVLTVYKTVPYLAWAADWGERNLDTDIQGSLRCLKVVEQPQK